MAHKYLPIFLLLLLQRAPILAQTVAPTAPNDLTKAFEKRIQLLNQQNGQLKSRLQLTTVENTRLQTLTASLQKTVHSQTDSIADQHTTIGNQHGQISQLTAQKNQLQADLTKRTDELKAANTQISHLEYDKKILVDYHIIRIYNFSADDVRKQFIRSLSAPESGFQYDDDLIDDEIQITRNFNDQAEAWWVFDKTLDTILELKIRIKPHLYDPQKALVFGETKLLQKTRYSNKPFEEQRDREKIHLYREKTLHLLEGKLSGTSDK